MKTIIERSWKSKTGKTITLNNYGLMQSDKIAISPVRTPKQIEFFLLTISRKFKTQFREVKNVN